MENIKLDTQSLSEEELKSQVGESDGLGDQIRRMIRNNKLAAFSAVVIIVICIMSICAPLLTPYGEAQQDLLNRLAAPSSAHIFGTDELGRDVFTRILYGSRVSLIVGILPSIIALVVGVALGLIAGYFGGWLDYVIMRFADVMLSVPSLLMAMVVMYTLGSSTLTLLIALSLTSWASVARVVRSQTLSIKESEYVEAATSIGVSKTKIMFKHIMPNTIPSLIVLFTLNIPSAILSESSLSFLGIGVQPPAASWGLIVNQAKQFLFTSPWLCLAPSLSIMIIVLAFNFLGDGLRDVLDPYMKK